MIEIIPNWHPFFVHFSIALLLISAGLHVLVAARIKFSFSAEMETVANWNLWLGAILSLLTIIAGWFAYNSVDHDTPSHLAMKDHRNWGIATAVVFLLLGIWSISRYRKAIAINWTMTVPVVIAGVLLLTTGWKGSELVYRHGLGVMSLPKTDAHDHGAHGHDDHAHEGQAEDSSVMQSEENLLQKESEHEVGEHAHEHGGHSHDTVSDEAEPGRSNDINQDNEVAAEGNEAASEEAPQTKEHTHDLDDGDHAH